MVRRRLLFRASDYLEYLVTFLMQHEADTEAANPLLAHRRVQDRVKALADRMVILRNLPLATAMEVKADAPEIARAAGNDFYLLSRVAHERELMKMRGASRQGGSEADDPVWLSEDLGTPWDLFLPPAALDSISGPVPDALRTTSAGPKPEPGEAAHAGRSPDDATRAFAAAALRYVSWL